MKRGWMMAAALGLSVIAGGCAADAGDAPAYDWADSRHDARIAELLSQMSVEAKVGQLIMPDISTITPEDVTRYRFGSILNGGNSGAGGNDEAPAPEWLALADAMWDAAMQPMPDGPPVIPMLWATDAVHGHSNIPGATIFPHNIGLGATRNADLMRRIGEATAVEIAVTGIDWTFAPTLAVATDDRWGRTYESFSEDTDLVSELGEAMIVGLQGAPGSADFLGQRRVIATAKHFFGDGGTGGLDRGDTRGRLEDLKAVHGAPYIPAINQGVQSVMASFSSINGAKMHGDAPLLTGYLRGEMGFGGLVVGDWNGHGELAGCTNDNCPQSLLAGLDIYMVPEDWRRLYANLLAQVNDGTIPMERLDEAVGRILRVKLEYGLFDKPRPSERELAGQWALLGSPEHREIARQAVRQSLVLLKNEGGVLPIAGSANVLVTGPGADSIAMQAGGWSITWQGGGELTNADFTGATSIYAGLAEAIAAGGGTATLSADGSYTARPDVAVVVFGEEPYAEFVGDREDLAFRDEAGLELLRRYDAAGIPTVAVFLSGRPLWVNRELALADAFVAAWLPGSEGQGVADVLVGDASGAARHDFTGKLSFTWPAACAPGGGEALFPFGAGWSYADAPPARDFNAECTLLSTDRAGQLRLFQRGLNAQVSAAAQDASGNATLANLVGASPARSLIVTAFDYRAQEDARRLVWTAPASLILNMPQGYRVAEGSSLVLTYSLDAVPNGRVQLQASGRSLDLTSTFTLGAGKGWRTSRVPLACVWADGASALQLRGPAGLTLSLAEIVISPESFGTDCGGPF
ncbi:glycoside hydrolase family 3 protein [Altererythrobacter lauratis]|uniref:Glycoside hydrolase family 3 N-terminal domain-containing protein n=1 Tax=Alteraurantiacibacter lauratis TaxID=2054627 RepID=A0ABV7EJY4_9SPHN